MCIIQSINQVTIFLFFIYFYILIILTNIKHYFNYVSEINITINGTGKQQILSSYSDTYGHYYGQFGSLPNETLVNGVPQSSIERYAENLLNKTNIITMRWNYQLTDCHFMFNKLNNIISIDLSNFDTSQVKFLIVCFIVVLL